MKITLISTSTSKQPSDTLKELAQSFSDLAGHVPEIKRLKLTGKIKNLKSAGVGFVLETQRKTMPNLEDKAQLEKLFKNSISFVTPVVVNGITKYPYISILVENQKNLATLIKRTSNHSK